MISLEFHPSLETLNSFLPILENEYNETGRGMFCNWDIILNSLKKDHVIVFREDNLPIGFITWYRDEKIVFLDIIWIIPKKRGKGIALQCQTLIDKEFKKRGDIALSLFCATIQGLKFAISANFQPDSSSAKYETAKDKLGLTAAYHKILKNNIPLITDTNSLYIRCYEIYNKQDSYFTSIPLNAKYAEKPTYFFVDADWWCEVVFNDKIIYKSQLKYILRDLKVYVNCGLVACFDKDITIPKHWNN